MMLRDIGGWRRSEHEPFGRARYLIKSYALGRGSFPGGRMARLRAFWHTAFLFQDGEICGSCGRPVARGIGTWWQAPDDLWMEVNGQFAGVTCPACFHDQCRERGIHIHYTATVWKRSSPAGVVSEGDPNAS